MSNTSNYGVQAPLQESLTTKNKDKIYTSYNYMSNQANEASVQSVHGVMVNHNGSKISSSLSQLPKSKKTLNNSQLLFNSTSKKLGSSATGNGNMLPQFARVDFDRLNRKADDSKIKIEKPLIQNDLTMQSYQDI